MLESVSSSTEGKNLLRRDRDTTRLDSKLTIKPFSCKREFKTSQFKFGNVSPELFYHSQWPIGDLAFSIYKTAVLVYTLVVIIHGIYGFTDSKQPRRPWPIFLTNWSYVILTAYSLCSFIIVLYNYVAHHRGVKVPPSKTTPFYIKLTWYFFAAAVPISYVVTLSNFIPTYPMKHVGPGDINKHIMNAVLATLEILVGAIPIRLLHIVHPILFFLAYIIFSIIYWAVDPENNILYPGFIDWSKPTQTVKAISIVCFCFLPLVHLIQYFMCQFRIWIYRKWFSDNTLQD